MKLSFIINFVVIFSLSANTYSQKGLFSLNLTGVSIKDVFRNIEANSNYRFFYNEDLNDIEKKIDISVKDKALSEILDKLLSNSGLAYRLLENNLIVVSPESILQQQKVSGTVTDASNGDPLPGVNITVQGTTVGTVSDVNGKYSVDVADVNAILVFSFVGYVSENISVNGKSAINVSLVADIKSLEEVVVIGYGTVKKSDLTGAVSSISSSDISDSPVQSVGQALQGRASGVKVTRQNGAPGSNTIIQIRGTNSIMGGNEPLIIIDGFPLTGGLDSFDPNDIETLEVLKDASSTSIYGARASNGVLIVTTKKGKSGTMKIDFDSYYGVRSPTKLIEFLNAEELMKLANVRAVNDNEAKLFFPDPSLVTADTDWQKEIFGKATVQNHNLTLTGGNDKIRFSTSGNYFQEDGILMNTGFEKFTFRSNMDATMNKWLTINNSMLIARSSRDWVNSGGDNDPITSAMKAPPTLPVYDADGNYQKLNIYTFSDGVVENPVAQLKEILNKDNSTRIFDNLSATLTILPGLTFKPSIGIDYTIYLNDYYASRKVQVGRPSGKASKSNNEYYSILNENIVNYNKSFGNNRIDLVGGYTWQKFRSTNFYAASNNFVSDDLIYNVLGAGSELVPPSSGGTEWGITSWLARANYTYNNKYLLTLSGRADGSSRFSTNNKWAYFPSAAMAWRVSEEEWMKNFILSNLKVRVSVGQTGNQGIDPYQTWQRMSSVQLSLGDALNIGYAPANIANKNLKWETTTQYDAGIDFGMFNERLRFSADYYYKKTTDLLARVDLPMSAGFLSSTQNIGQMSNEGVEFTVDARPFVNEFKWDVNFNISTNKNKIIKLSKGADLFANGAGGLLTSMHILREGYPISMFYGYVQDGMDDNGFMKYKDLNNDGKISDLDRDFIGKPHPDFMFGLSNSFSYKNFDLNIFLEGSYGFDIINVGRYEYANSFYKGQNQIKEVYDSYWTPENRNAKYPKPSFKNTFKPSDQYVEDGSYIKIRNITLAYNIPVNNVKWCRNAQIYVAAQNYFTFTKYSWYDPEVSQYGSGDLRLNVDNKSYPQAKTITVGVKLGL